MSNSGAKAALKGYRLQTLYILYEILQSRDSELIFQPEGNEDLAIYQGAGSIYLKWSRVKSDYHVIHGGDGCQSGRVLSEFAEY